jgi:YfiH family protein
MTERVFLPVWPDLPAHIGVLSTLRNGGVSLLPFDDGSGTGGFNLASHVGDRVEHVLKNRARLAQFLPANPQWLEQVHGVHVVDLGMADQLLCADACITSRANVVCAVQTADCLPVLFCDAKSNVVGAAHAGWRGLVNGVLENTLATMLGSGADLDAITVWMGPAIGPSQFEVGAEVRKQFLDADSCAVAAFKVSTIRPDKFYADLYHLARLRLQRAGVRSIHGGGFCTVTEPEKFYSYRRDGVTGRMASLIWIKDHS